MIGRLWRLLGVRSREPVDDAARPAALTAEERRVIREAAGRAAGRAFSRRAATEGDPK